jgi:hypothetical protein
MPALKPTGLAGTIVWLGHVPDRSVALASAPQRAMDLTFAGPAGEDHGGLTRPSCSRVRAQYKRGTQIRNTRQLSVMCQQELDAIAQKMGIAGLDPAWVGATLVISGLPDFSHLPPSSRLQSSSGATLTIDMQNRPCHLPAPVIEAAVPGAGKAFKRAAQGLRGVTAWVEREGTLSIGDEISLHIPDQRAWKV